MTLDSEFSIIVNPLFSTGFPTPIPRPSLKKLQQLQPLGLAWTTDSDAELSKLTEAVSYEFDRVESEVDVLLSESLPSSAVQLLLDWEAFVGLPSTGSIEERQTALATKLGDDLGQDDASWEALGTRLGYTVVVNGFTAFLCTSPCTAPVADPEWAFVLEVTTPHGAKDAALMAAFNRHKQSHTFIWFNFT